MSVQVVYCPFCGAPNELAGAVPGELEGTILCRICGQEMDRPGARGVCEAEEYVARALGPQGRKVLAWEEEGGGLIGRWWRTCWQVLLRPGRSFEGKEWVGWAWPVSFAIIMVSLRAVLMGLGEAFRGVEVQPLIVVSRAVGMMMGVVVSGLMVHGGLRVVGGGKGGLRRTVEVMCYAEAASVLWVVPVVGPAVGGVWELVVAVVGLGGVHGMSRLRVVGAMVVVVVGIGLVLGLVWAGWVVGVLSALRLRP